MQSEANATWRLQLDDLEEGEGRRRITILRALLTQLTVQLGELEQSEADAAGSDVDGRVFLAADTLRALRAELEPLLA
jgi:hypothetical protein